jgi:transcriptional regulator with PAS, ATPase and Fis domain
LKEIEADVILTAMRMYTTERAAASALGISIIMLRNRINKYGLRSYFSQFKKYQEEDK